MFPAERFCCNPLILLQMPNSTNTKRLESAAAAGMALPTRLRRNSQQHNNLWSSVEFRQRPAHNLFRVCSRRHRPDEIQMTAPHDPRDQRNQLPRELIELGRKIAALPEAEYQELQHSYTRVVDCVRRRRRILELVQEALAQLRLDIKYLMFDLEVTRRERDEFKAQLDEIQQDGYESW